MKTVSIGVIVAGATGRICTTQHLQRALVPIRAEGGVAADGVRILPEPVLAGRDAGRLEAAARRFGLERWTTDIPGALADPANGIYFDSAISEGRADRLEAAVRAGKHVYAEKPAVADPARGAELVALAARAGVRHGAVEDKLFLPGLHKLRLVRDSGFFGRIVSFQLNTGYWVFSGHGEVPCQRASWNYQRAGGGGQIGDMFPHWRYVIEGLLGPVRRVAAMAWTGTHERIDEAGRPYPVDVEDSAAAMLELEGGVRGTINSSGATRVRRDDVLTLQVDGTRGSAVAGLHRCRIQPLAGTPRAVWDQNADAARDYLADWMEVPETTPPMNGYRAGWEAFLRHVVTGAPMASDLAAGIRDVAFADACYRSAAGGGWVDMPPA